MADIAMLVAEEYERRMKKNSRKSGNVEGKEVDLFSGVSVFLAKRVVDGWSLFSDGDYIKEMIPNPKSQIAVAAFNALFSA